MNLSFLIRFLVINSVSAKTQGLESSQKIGWDSSQWGAEKFSRCRGCAALRAVYWRETRMWERITYRVTQFFQIQERLSAAQAKPLLNRAGSRKWPVRYIMRSTPPGFQWSWLEQTTTKLSRWNIFSFWRHTHRLLPAPCTNMTTNESICPQHHSQSLRVWFWRI